MGHNTLEDERVLAARRSMSQRIGALEDRVTDTLEHAQAAVKDTTTAIKSTVEDVSGNVRGLMGSASENISSALDVRKKLSDHPLEGTLLAVGAGLLAWFLTQPRGAVASQARSALASTTTPGTGPLADIYAAFRKELVGVGEAAAASAGKLLKENIQTLVAQHSDGNRLTYEDGRRHVNSMH